MDFFEKKARRLNRLQPDGGQPKERAAIEGSRKPFIFRF